MNLSNYLWENNKEFALVSLNSKFVQGLKNGDLPKKNFQAYIAQDYFFLESFARAYGLAISKSSDINAIRILSELLFGVSEELILHETYANKWGINLSKNKIEKATQEYTDFLSQTSQNLSCVETLAAMTPCMRLYAWIGYNLSNSTSNNPYKDWIKTYSDDSFEKLAKSLENTIDSYQSSIEITQINNLYKKAMILEGNFFIAYSNF
tara:strand:+ start:120 stop:743 length:624 start_codon:yes stop_codon:yes gene_type:complete